MSESRLCDLRKFRKSIQRDISAGSSHATGSRSGTSPDWLKMEEAQASLESLICVSMTQERFSNRMSDVSEQTCSSYVSCDTMSLSYKHYLHAFDVVTDGNVKCTRVNYEKIIQELRRWAAYDSNYKGLDWRVMNVMTTDEKNDRHDTDTDVRGTQWQYRSSRYCWRIRDRWDSRDDVADVTISIVPLHSARHSSTKRRSRLDPYQRLCPSHRGTRWDLGRSSVIKRCSSRFCVWPTSVCQGFDGVHDAVCAIRVSLYSQDIVPLRITEGRIEEGKHWEKHCSTLNFWTNNVAHLSVSSVRDWIWVSLL